MVPSQALIDAIPAALVATGAILDGTGNVFHVHLAKAPFSPTPAMALGALTEADFGGYAILDGPSAPAAVYLDPLTGYWVIEITAPLGGWHYLTASGVNLPQTIFGAYLTDTTDAVLLGSALLDNPVPLTIAGQGFDLPPQIFTLTPVPLS